MNRTHSTCAFFVVANSKHFLGLTALVNSLRLVGHTEPIVVADQGLHQDERVLLADQVTLVEAPATKAPHLAKTAAPLAHPADVMVLVDADVIVTRPLDALIARAGPGKVVAFADKVGNRFDERWSELLGLGPLRCQTYVNSGLVVTERTVGTALLEQVARGCEHVDPRQSAAAANGTSDYPFYYLDQDVLNAVLATRDPEQIDVLDHELAPFPPFRGLELVDQTTLRCAYRDGREPFLLHHIGAKPWLSATRWNLYSSLLARLLLEPDVAIPLHPDRVPLRLRNGGVAWLEKRRCDAVASLAQTRGRLGLRPMLARHFRAAKTTADGDDRGRLH